jgi:hypothetical protein
MLSNRRFNFLYIGYNLWNCWKDYGYRFSDGYELLVNVCVSGCLIVISHKQKVKEIDMRKFSIAWYQANPEYVAEQNRIYDSKRPKHWSGPGDDDYYKTKLAAHKLRAEKLNRTAAWADEAKIEQIFKDCPADMSIHHDFPLGATEICGLHHELNLRYLPLSENSRLGNAFKPRRSIIYRATISLV